MITKNWQGSNKCNQCDHKSIKQAQSGSNTSFIIFIESWTDIYMGNIYRYIHGLYIEIFIWVELDELGEWGGLDELG